MTLNMIKDVLQERKDGVVTNYKNNFENNN